MEINDQFDDSWQEILQFQFKMDYFIELQSFLALEKEKNKIIYPPDSTIFNALKLTPYNNVKVVILGQDPYHGIGQAHGLCFSVQYGIKLPPSLKNIFKELYLDLGILPPNHGNLSNWAKDGVLLLNSILTVEANSPASHQNKGWEIFTDSVIQSLSEKRDNLVFLLWGKYAQSKADLIDTSKHLILKAAHPSPFSAHNGFFGCKHFSETNNFLSSKGISTINWKLPNIGLFD